MKLVENLTSEYIRLHLFTLLMEATQGERYHEHTEFMSSVFRHVLVVFKVTIGFCGTFLIRFCQISNPGKYKHQDSLLPPRSLLHLSAVFVKRNPGFELPINPVTSRPLSPKTRQFSVRCPLPDPSEARRGEGSVGFQGRKNCS